jgi:hypothetical protein
MRATLILLLFATSLLQAGAAADLARQGILTTSIAIGIYEYTI